MSNEELVKELLHQSEVYRIMGDIPHARLLKQAGEKIRELAHTSHNITDRFCFSNV